MNQLTIDYANKLLGSRAVLSIDIETYSSVDIGKCGLYKYVEADDFEILLFAYSYNFGETHVIDLTVDWLPDEVIADVLDPTVAKTAFNAAFEIACLDKYIHGITGKHVIASDNWFCTMVRAGSLGLPMSLDGASEVLKLKNAKLKVGKDLIRLFCVPQKETK